MMQDEAYFWAVECSCGSLIHLAPTMPGAQRPRLRIKKIVFTVFCERCGQIACTPEDIKKLRGSAPTEYWPRTDLFEAGGHPESQGAVESE
jgi:hypothetical protein